jgi:hypothetical protein
MENAAENDYDLHKIIGNLKAHLECKSNEEFRISLIKGMLLFLLVRYILACNIIRKEEENLRMIYILFTILLAQTLFYIDQAEC